MEDSSEAGSSPRGSVGNEIFDQVEKLMAEADATKPPPFPHADRAPTGRAKCQECGEPIARGELTLASPSGRKTGPFPVNAAGLKVATVAPGRVVPTGRAPGYRDAVGDEVELLAGKETEIVLRLRKAAATSGS